MRKMKSKRTDKRIEEYEQVVLEARIAQQFYDLRKGMGLTKEQLAKKIGTSASVISRLEDARLEEPPVRRHRGSLHNG